MSRNVDNRYCSQQPSIPSTGVIIMLTSVLFREDNVYKAFPDIVECEEGWLVCVCRESLGHAALPFGRIACHISRTAVVTGVKRL